jgi:hypothetical protein
MLVSENTLLLLGVALFRAQRVEFLLYGIASHLSHLDVAKTDKIFSKITARDFLSDDPKTERLRKATLGHIYKLFGDKLLISGLPFDLLVKERNFFVHDFFRSLKTSNNDEEHIQRLKTFIDLVDITEKALKGLLSNLMEASAKKEDREHELVISQDDKENRKFYETFVMLHILKQEDILIVKAEKSDNSVG